jgi:hypothetical protein
MIDDELAAEVIASFPTTVPGKSVGGGPDIRVIVKRGWMNRLYVLASRRGIQGVAHLQRRRGSGIGRPDVIEAINNLRKWEAHRIQELRRIKQLPLSAAPNLYLAFPDVAYTGLEGRILLPNNKMRYSELLAASLEVSDAYSRWVRYHFKREFGRKPEDDEELAEFARTVVDRMLGSGIGWLGFDLDSGGRPMTTSMSIGFTETSSALILVDFTTDLDYGDWAGSHFVAALDPVDRRSLLERFILTLVGTAGKDFGIPMGPAAPLAGSILDIIDQNELEGALMKWREAEANS